MQIPSESVGHVGRCKSASAADFQFYSQRRLRNCRHERAAVTSCSENSGSEWSQKFTAALPSTNDANEVVCRRRQQSTDVQTGNLATCGMPSRRMSSHAIVSSFHTECHCVACCSCSPLDRRSGNCPAFSFPVRTQSVRRALSLESGLALCRSCSRRLSAAKDTSCTDLVDLVQSSVESDTVIHKSSSVPACCTSQMRYYTAGISFDSLNDDACQTHSVAVDSTSSNSSPVCNGSKSAGIINQSAVPPSENPMPPAGMSSKGYMCMNNQVSPEEYHKRFEVCSFAADILTCSFICIVAWSALLKILIEYLM